MRRAALLSLALLGGAPVLAQATRVRVNVDYGLGASGGLLTSSTFKDDVTTGIHKAVTVSIPLKRFGEAKFTDSFVGLRAGYTQVIDSDTDYDNRDVASPAVYLEMSLSGPNVVSPWITLDVGYDVYNRYAHGKVLGLLPTLGAGAGVQFKAGPLHVGTLFGGSFTSIMEGASAYLRASGSLSF